MMGGYAVYLNDVLMGQINEGQLFIKITLFGQNFTSDLMQGPPYPCSRPAFVVPEEKLSDQQ